MLCVVVKSSESWWELRVTRHGCGRTRWVLPDDRRILDLIFIIAPRSIRIHSAHGTVTDIETQNNILPNLANWAETVHVSEGLTRRLPSYTLCRSMYDQHTLLLPMKPPYSSYPGMRATGMSGVLA